MKKITDKLFWVLLVVMGFYFLYQKGMIMTDFPSVSSKVAYEMIQNDEGNLTVLDVRTPEEYKLDGHLADAKIIPLSWLNGNLKMLDKSKTILVYCRSGSRSVSASRLLSENGFTVINMSGGLLAWQAEKLPIKMK